jgi:hypothetical protein
VRVKKKFILLDPGPDHGRRERTESKYRLLATPAEAAE